jgi:hypothetical protein
MKINRQRAWKLESWATGALGAFLAQLLIRTIYRTIRKDKPVAAVFDPNDRRFSWSDAAIWAVAGGLGLAMAKIASARVAAIGWRAATGTAPPETDDPTPG